MCLDIFHTNAQILYRVIWIKFWENCIYPDKYKSEYRLNLSVMTKNVLFLDFEVPTQDFKDKNWVTYDSENVVSRCSVFYDKIANEWDFLEFKEVGKN